MLHTNVRNSERPKTIITEITRKNRTITVIVTVMHCEHIESYSEQEHVQLGRGRPVFGGSR